jgi:hypothetical protein
MTRNIVHLSVYLLLICCALPLMAQSAASADSVVPGMVKFTGTLNDTSGKPLTGTVGVTFLLYTEQSGGAPLWMETQNVRADKNGHYSVMLGSATSKGIPADAFVAGQARWLGVQPSGQAEQARVMLASVPYSLKALDAETLGGRPASSFMTAPAAGTKSKSAAPPAEQANEIVCVSGSACKAGSIPLFATHGGSAKVKDSIITQAGTTVTVAGTENVSGDVNSGGGIHASGNVNANTVSASSIDATNFAVGSGISAVVGTAAASGNSGITFGVFGSSLSDTGRGVFGEATGANGTAVWGEGGTTGSAENGVVGVSHGPASGVFGANDQSNGIGVAAINDFGGDALYAEANAGGFAAFFNGDVDVDGTLSKAAGTFKIDHPLDPANKYLYHSFVESPDMMNIYNGIVTLDASGEAAVALPEWFGALNRDFRYQLTAVGAPAPNLHIAEKVQNNNFKIGGGQPGMEVSWQVTGIRQDAYANAHRTPVEQAKPERERGLYLHPELFGAPAEKSIAAAHHAVVKAVQESAGKGRTVN